MKNISWVLICICAGHLGLPNSVEASQPIGDGDFVFYFLDRFSPSFDPRAVDIVVSPGETVRFGRFGIPASGAMAEGGYETNNEGQLNLRVAITNNALREQDDFSTNPFIQRRIIPIPTILPPGATVDMRGCNTVTGQLGLSGFDIQRIEAAGGTASSGGACQIEIDWVPTLEDVGQHTIALEFRLYTFVNGVWDTVSTFDIREIQINVTDLGIDGVEPTQSIQIVDPMAYLQARGARVPLIADKPLRVRVFPGDVSKITRVSPKLVALDPATQHELVLTKDPVLLFPGCSAEERRLNTKKGSQTCNSIDFDIATPGEGFFWVNVVFEDDDGNVLAKANFPTTIWEASREVEVRTVEFCYSYDETFDFCGELDKVPRFAKFAQAILPTAKVIARKASIAPIHVMAPNLDIEDRGFCYDPDGNPAPDFRDIVDCDLSGWWDYVTYQVSVIGSQPIREKDPDRLTAFYGATAALEGGVLGYASIGGLAFSSNTFPLTGFDEQDGILSGAFAHELIHSAGVPHTGTAPDPALVGKVTTPLCFGRADPGDGPYFDFSMPPPDDRLRTFSDITLRTEGGVRIFDLEGLPALDEDGLPVLDNQGSLEFTIQHGFDLRTNRPVDGNRHFAVMSYCFPYWITPWEYAGLLETNTNEDPTLFRSFAKIDIRIDSDGLASLDPVFIYDTVAPIGNGQGEYSVEFLDGAGNTVAVREVDVSESHPIYTDGSTPPVIRRISTMLPYAGNVAELVVTGPAGEELLAREMTGAGPAVEFETDFTGLMSGETTVDWESSANDTLTSWLLYSNDAGESWNTLVYGAIDETFSLDAGELPGSNGLSQLRVMVSDGLRSAEATSSFFSVEKHQPTATIISPEAEEAFRRDETIAFIADANDLDDLSGDSLTVQWESSIDGIIGNSESANVAGLSVGDHLISLAVRDGDGNVVFAQTPISVVGGPIADVVIENDADNDGFGPSADCNNSDPAISPDAVDIPNNGIDENCDGQDAVELTLLDQDADSFSPVRGDCDDQNALVNPGAEDIPGNGIDEDCDGSDATPQLIPGDLDQDGDVDRDDVMIVAAARNQPASGGDDPRDIDGDGTITANDARQLTRLCTRSRCATE